MTTPRLKLLNDYLTEAKLDEANNKLYIEDLLVSIKYEERIQPKPRPDIILNASLEE